MYCTCTYSIIQVRVCVPDYANENTQTERGEYSTVHVVTTKLG